MSTPNTSSRWCWAYESVPETAEITAVDTTTYWFGYYPKPDPEWEPPSSKNAVSAYFNYGSREPAGLSKLNSEFPTFSHPYEPSTPQWLSRFLKYPATGTPITIGVLDTGTSYPITIRHEQNDGTNNKLNQAAGCYTVGVTATFEQEKPLSVDEKFAWCKLEDQGDRSALTTSPDHSGGCDVAGPYVGTPHFTWNSVQYTGVWKVIYLQDQNFEAVYDPTNDVQSIKIGNYETPKLLVHAVLPANTCWDDFFDRTSRTCILKCYKSDGTTYIQITITGAYITEFKEKGTAHKGYYQVIFGVEGTAISATANSCNTNFSTHYKAAVS